MITLKQIATAINDKLIEVLPDIPIQSTDISEGFQRPSLFVEFDNVTTAAYGARGRERRISTTIYYFPKDRNKNKLELLEIQEALEEVFSTPFPIHEGFTVYPVDVSSDKVDSTLQLSFEVYYIEINDHEDGEDMADLQLNIEKRD